MQAARGLPGQSSLLEGGQARAGQGGLESPGVEGCGDEWLPGELTVGAQSMW